MNEPKFPFRPLGARVVVKPNPRPTKSGLLHIPESATYSVQTKTGTVVQVGPGQSTPKGNIPVQLKRGDLVFFGEFAGVEVSIGNQPFLVMDEKEVTGVLETVAALNDPSVFQKFAEHNKAVELTKEMEVPKDLA